MKLIFKIHDYSLRTANIGFLLHRIGPKVKKPQR